MGKFCIRITVIAVSIYILVCYLSALVFDVYLWSHIYTVLLELCVCLCISAQGNYHCKYIKWTAYGLTLSDLIASVDELFDIVPLNILAFLPPILIILGLGTTTTLAIRHYAKIQRIKRKYRKWEKKNQVRS